MPNRRLPIRLGLQARIAILTVAGLVALSSALAWIALRGVSTGIDATLQQRLTVAQTIAMHVDYRFDHMKAELARAADWPGFDPRDDDPEPELEALASTYHSGLFSGEVFVADTQGVVLAIYPQRSGAAGARVSPEGLVGRAVSSGQAQVSGLAADVQLSYPFVTLVVPVRDAQGSPYSLIGATLDLTSPAYVDFLGTVVIGRTGHARVIDDTGAVLFSTLPWENGTPSHFSGLLATLVKQGNPYITTNAVASTDQAAPEVLAFVPLGRLGWGVSVEQDYTELLAPIEATRTQILIAAGLALVIALLSVWTTARHVTQPVIAIAAAAQRVAVGDLDSPLQDFGDDEIGQLAQDFKVMRLRLRESRELLVHWNAELEHQVAQRTRQLTSLQDSLRQLTADLSLEAALEAIIEASRNLFGADRCAVFLLTPKSDELTCVLRHGLSAEYTGAVCRNYASMPGGVARALARTVLVPDALNEPRMSLVADLVRREGFLSILILPLIHHQRVAGAFALYHDRPHAFSPEEIPLGEAFAAQAAVAIENARLFEAATRRARQLALIGEVARQGMATLDPNRLLAATAEALVRAFDYYDVVVLVLEPRAPGRTLEARAGRLERSFSQVARDPGAEHGIINWVLGHGETLLANDVTAEPRYDPLIPGTRSELCVPIKDGERVIGAINIESDQAYDFDPGEAAALEALGAELVVALRNAQLYAETRRRAEELAALFEFSAALQAAERPEEIPELALDRALALTSMEAGLVLLIDAESGEPQVAAARGTDMTPEFLREAHCPVTLAAAKGHTCPGAESAESPCPLARLMPGVSGCTCAPLRATSGVIGLLHIHTYRDGDRGARESDLRLLETIGNQTALALERARLAESLRRHAAGLAEEVAARTEEIRAQHERTEAILRSVGDAVIVVDAEGRVVPANPMARMWLQRAEHDLVALVQRLADGAEGTEELCIEDRVLQANASRVTEDEHVLGTVVVLRDITGLKELDRLKSQFVSNVTHELRTPLTSIKLYLGLLRRRGAAGMDRYLPVLEREAERLHMLIEGVLALSRMELGKADIRPEPLDLGEMAATLLSDRQALAGERGLTASCFAAPACPPVMGDPSLLPQVISNLVTNAMYYTPRGGSVRIAIQPAGERWVTMTVTDTGLGIAPEDLPHLFERFYRGRSSDQTGTPGTGLGLSICKEIVDRHGGRIEVESTVGAGSTFTVWLPAARF